MSAIAIRNIIGEDRNVVLVRLRGAERPVIVPFSEEILNQHGEAAVIRMAEGLVRDELYEPADAKG